MNNQSQRGQVLLITVMLLATALTVVLTVSFKSTTETQTTKLQEESQKALAAAEAGIEAALKQGSISDIRSLNLTGIGSGNVTVSSATGKTHISRNLNTDEQYTFYLGSGGDPPDFTDLTPAYNGALNICFSAAALEITLINKDHSNYSIRRYAVNPRGSTIIENAPFANAPGASDCPNNPFGSTFSSIYNIPSGDITDDEETGGILLIVRPINNSTKLGFQAGLGATTNLPIQGKTVTSTASTVTGATKKVQLFQSYPQIPSEFFVTSF